MRKQRPRSPLSRTRAYAHQSPHASTHHRPLPATRTPHGAEHTQQTASAALEAQSKYMLAAMYTRSWADPRMQAPTLGNDVLTARLPTVAVSLMLTVAPPAM